MMKQALARLLGSAKFWTAILGMVATAGASLLARYGLELSDAAIQQIAITVSGIFVVLLGAQGAADFGKSAAVEQAKSSTPTTQQNVTVNEAPSPPPSPVARIGQVTLMLLVVFAFFGVVACGAVQDSSKRVAGDVVDCMKPEAKRMIGELVPAFLDVLKNATGNDGKIDWQPVRSTASSLRSPATRCAFSAAIAEVLRPKQKAPGAPQSSELEADPADVRAGFDAIRMEFYGGAKFDLETGRL